MKRLSIVLGVIILAFTVNAQNIMLQTGSKGVVKSNDQFSGFQATFSYDQIESVTITGTERGTFSAITIAGTYVEGELGMPQLPVFKKMIAVPVGATPKVVVRNYTSHEYNLEEHGFHTLFPAQADVRKDEDTQERVFAYNEKVYNSNEYTHSSMAQVEVLGTMRGVVVGMLVVRPVQYNPVSHSIMVYNNVDVEVTFENGDYQKTQELYKNTFSPYFAKVYGNLLNRGMYEDHPDLYNTPVRMLVIANRMFEETLEPWIEWKTKKGFYMDVNYTDVIGSTAAAIKTFCHNKYNQGIGNGTAPTFIVFVGDTPQVPASQTGSQSAKATDLYYAKVNTGSYWFPDMYYSRLSATTTQQLANQIEKILYYEKYQFADPSYLDNVLLIAGADGTWNPRVGQPTINYATNYYFNAAHGYTNVHKYLNSYSGCYSHFNNVGFANYTAHCSEDSWGDPNYTCTQVSSLTNVNKYFVAMGNCCLAADFGWTGPNGIPGVTGECFGETMMRAEKKGTVGYIGSSPSSYWGGDFHFAVGAYADPIETITNPTMENTTTGCYDFMFGDADFNTLCSYIYGGNLAVTYAHSMGYTTHVHANYYWEAYNVLGDGSLMPYNTQADDNTVSHLPVIYIGLPTYDVMAVQGSYVAISKDGVLLGTAIANTSGIATVTLNPLVTSGGNVDIVVTRNQYKPYMTQVPAVAQSGPYIVPAGYTVVGEEHLTYISTNKEIEVTLNNVGIETTDNLTVTITCTDPQLTINNGTATCSGIAPNGSAIVKFTVTVSNDIPDNKTFMVDVTTTENGKGSWEGKLPLKAYAPVFFLEKVLVNGVDGGNLDAGTVVTLTPVVKNKGGADAYKVKGDLDIHSPYVTFACEEQTGTGKDLPAGETIEMPFVVVTDPGMPYGHQADIDLLLAAQYGRTATAPFAVSYTGSNNYCVPGSTNCSGFNDRITSLLLIKTSDQSVLINDPSPTCSSNGYTDYTSVTAELTPGEQYTIKVKVGYNNHKVKGWIDLNGNNVFDNNEAMFVVACATSGVEYSQNFTVPSDFVPGSHRFRIRTRDGGTEPEPCNAYSYGQTLDYTAALPELYPRVENVVAVLGENSITVTWDAPVGGTPNGYNIYRDGDKLNTALLTATTFTEENVVNGVYAYNVTAVYGTKESFAQMSNVICNFTSYDIVLLAEPAEAGTVEGGGTYPAGEEITVCATPNPCYVFVNWTEDDVEVSKDSCYTFVVTENRVLVANFELETYEIIVLANPTNGGTVSGGGTYPCGTEITISAVPDSICEFIKWMEDDNMASTNADYQFIVTSSRTLTANFDCEVGIDEVQTNSYKIFPNPAHDELNITGSVVPNSVRMYNITGQLVYETAVCSTNMRISVATMPEGVYFIKIDSDNGSTTQKLIIK